MKWFFSTNPDGVVELIARVSTGEMLGDARETVGPGEMIFGLTYLVLHDAKAGTIEVNDKGQGTIV